MMFSITTLGTASAMPVVNSYQSAQVLDVHGRFFLIDCGEGAQVAMMKNRIPMQKIDVICISHIHGDHVFGLFGLLSTLGMQGRTATMSIFGPRNLGPILNFFVSYYGKGLLYDIKFHPLTNTKPEIIYDKKKMCIEAFPLNHKIETYGYIFREKEPQLNVSKEALKKYDFTLTEIGALKRGEDILRPAGKESDADFFNGFTKYSGTDEPLLIKNEEATYKPYEPRSYAYCSDTAPFDELVSWISGVDYLYHEATFLKEYTQLAKDRFHSTTLQAAETAKNAGVKKLIVGHYSSRCRESKKYESECKTIFPNTVAATDGDVFTIPLIKNN